MSTIKQGGARVSGLVAAAGVGLALVASGCKGKKEDTTPKDAAADAAIPKVDPTLCETEGKNVLTYDLNKDTRPDVWRLYKSEDEGGTTVEYMTCKQVDFDHDGRKDWVVGYNRKGTVLYERADFDYDGKFDMSSVFDPKTGTVLEIDRDTDFDGKYDLKEIYDRNGVLSSVRRDRNGDGEPDLWEQYKNTVLLAILYDDDFDHKVDRREEIPGARPKIEMPTNLDEDTSSDINEPAAPAPADPKKPATPAPAKK
jgi:hypothetical protein